MLQTKFNIAAAGATGDGNFNSLGAEAGQQRTEEQRG
jgi:hypothetical protein